jgi:hypothetical protein
MLESIAAETDAINRANSDVLDGTVRVASERSGQL